MLYFGRAVSGNASPLRVFGGASTGMSSPNGLDVDPGRGDVYVANSLGNSITVYTRFLSGAVSPQRSIVGAGTQLNNPQFLVVLTALFADGFESP